MEGRWSAISIQSPSSWQFSHNNYISYSIKLTIKPESYDNNMCRGNLQYFGGCGHEKKFHPTEVCPYYLAEEDKCLGTLTICHQTVIHSPELCIPCAVRIEAGMILERDHAITAYKEKIATLNRAMSKEKNAHRHRAMFSERAGVTKAMTEFTEKKEKELSEFRKELGKDAPGRGENLDNDWWNDEEVDLARF